jgi:hypothetical protein
MCSKPVVVMLLSLTVSSEATAQHVPPGTRVRLTTPESFAGWHVGNLTAMTRDSVRIVYATGDSATISLADVGLIDSSGGRHTPLWAVLSGVVLTPAGATVGIMGGLIASMSERYEIGESVQRGAWIGTAVGLTAGLIIAGTVKIEDWNPVMLPARTEPLAGNSTGAVSDAPMYRPRMRLKLRVAGNKIVGTLIEQRADSIVLAKNAAHTTYPVASVTDVYVSRGKSAWSGAKFGALVGGGVGLAIGVREAMLPNDDSDRLRDPDCDAGTTACRYETDVATVTGRVMGSALLGALAGAVVRRERWVQGTLPASARDGEPARLLLGPGRGGVRVGVHATF